MKYILVSVLCSTLSVASIAEELSSFKAVYKIGIPNMTAAEMAVAVQREGNKFLYQSKVYPNGLIGHLLNIQAHSYSKIIKRNGYWLPLIYEKEVADKNKKQLYRFDWKTRKAQVLYKGEQYDLDLIKGTVDENTFQLQLRNDVINTLDSDFDKNYILLSDGRLKERRFVKQSEEVVETGLGKFNTIRIERYKNETLDQIYWLSPEHDYLPLKMVTMNGKKIKTTVTLAKIKFIP